MPAPFGPTMPSRSRGSRWRSRPRNSQASPYPSPTPCSSTTWSPRRGVSTCSGSSPERAGASAVVATRAVAASMRACGLAGARRRPAAQPGQLRAGQVAPTGVGLGRAQGALGPSIEPALVAADVDVGPPAVDLEHGRGDAIEHVPVVGHQHEAAGKAGQPVLEPDDAVQIEVVGRLVEDEQVALVRGAALTADAHEHARQRHALLLAARELGHIDIQGGAHPEPVEHRGPFPRAAHDLGHGARWEGGVLVEHRGARAPPSPHRTGLRVEGAGEDLEQRGLAAAVDADHPEAVPARNGDRQVVEERLARTAGRHPGRVDEDHLGILADPPRRTTVAATTGERHPEMAPRKKKDPNAEAEAPLAAPAEGADAAGGATGAEGPEWTAPVWREGAEATTEPADTPTQPVPEVAPATADVTAPAGDGAAGSEPTASLGGPRLAGRRRRPRAPDLGRARMGRGPRPSARPGHAGHGPGAHGRRGPAPRSRRGRGRR